MSVKKCTIQVTQEDIDKGEPGSSCNCPVALAVNRTLKPMFIKNGNTITAITARVRACTIVFRDIFEFAVEEIALPLPVTKFIGAFDNEQHPGRERLSPFEFEIEVPEEIVTGETSK